MIDTKTWVSEIINFDDYEQYVEYTKDFDWKKSVFLYDFLFHALEYLMTHNGNPLKIKIEDHVTLMFQLNFVDQTIVMSYYDERAPLLVEYNTIKDTITSNRKYSIQPYDSASTTYVETEKHRVINKPILHKTKLILSKSGTHYDFDETTKKFADEFIVFANVIDKEHEEMCWLMEQKERESKNRLPRYENPPPPPPRPKPRIIKE